MLIKRIYQADPLLCLKCGGTMKIIALIAARLYISSRSIPDGTYFLRADFTKKTTEKKIVVSGNTEILDFVME